MFLMAIPGGSVLPEWWLSKSGLLVQTSPEYSLKSGGKLVFTVEHPVFTAYGTQDWYYNEKGEILHFPVDNYYYECKRTAVFLGEKVTKFHIYLL